MRTIIKSSTLIILAAVFEFSCATILGSSSQDIRLNTSPSGANVTINGRNMGITTPCVVNLKRKVRATASNNKNEYHYIFEKEGYAKAEYIDFKRTNPQIWWNLVVYPFAFITFPVDFISGSAFKYNSYVTVNLYPEKGAKNIAGEDNKKINNTDKKPPVIKIYSPDLERGFKQIVQEEIFEISGIATDESGVFDVEVNGVSARLAIDGSFKANINLMVGNNDIMVVAKDKYMNTTAESFHIERVSVENKITINKDEVQHAGTYYALIIGIQDYLDPTFTDLEEPLSDAKNLYKILTQNYNFDPANVLLMENPGRDNITLELENYFNKLNSNDNLLIFYAGHGYWDDKFKQGYWLPSDARYNNRGTWLSNGTIRDYMRAIPCKHNLLISDACFSGGIFKSRDAFPDASKAINELYELPSRKAMTSGALNQVPDKSVFLEYLIKRLQENEQKYLSSEQLFASFKVAVINNSPQDQVPQYGEVKETGDEGGDFIFIRK